MRLKIIICFFVLYIIHPNTVFSIGNDSIKLVSLSDKLVWNDTHNKYELSEMSHLFFDADVQKIIVGFELKRMHPNDTSQFVFLEIKKKSLQQFRLRPVVSKKINLSSTPLYIDSLDLSDSLFASGNFDVIVSYMNDSFKVLDVKKVSFQLLRAKNNIIKDEFYTVGADKLSSDINLEKTFVQKYDIVQLKKNIASLSPMAKGAEGKVIKELSSVEDIHILKQFFYNFWYNRNPSDPEKAWSDYVIILNDLAKKYGNAHTPGYETDRGRIYIQYGAPDRVERVSNEKNALPYEVWFYYNSGIKHNLKFLFFQPGMLGNEMLLLHSNVPEEIVNPYWKRILLKDPNNSDNKLTHKVFEFFNEK